MAAGTMPVELAPYGDELARLLRALCGLEAVVSNVNLPNAGQMPGLRQCEPAPLRLSHTSPGRNAPSDHVR